MKILIILIFCFIFNASSLQCWTGTIEEFADGERSQYITTISCDAGYCSNLTVFRGIYNSTELHCGSELLKECDSNKLGCFLIESRTAEMCCCNSPLCNDASYDSSILFTQLLSISFTLFLFPFVHF